MNVETPFLTERRGFVLLGPAQGGTKNRALWRHGRGFTPGTLPGALKSEIERAFRLFDGQAFDFGVYLQNNKWYATQYSSSHDIVRMNANTSGGLDIYNQTDNGFANVRVGSLNIGSTTVIDSSRNLTNIGTISSGEITSTGSGDQDLTINSSD